MDALTTQEQQSLTRCEKTIERGLDTFQAVGKALLEVRDAKLYRNGFETFADYCQKKWNFTRQRAHQLIDAAKTVKSVSNIFDIKNEAAAQELGKVPEGKRQEVVDWINEKTDGKPITAKAIREAAEEVLEAEPEDTELDEPAPDWTSNDEPDYDDEPNEEIHVGNHVHETAVVDDFTDTAAFLNRKADAAECEAVYLAKVENWLTDRRNRK
jgi:hypothetical protein